jgi:putative endonuclease
MPDPTPARDGAATTSPGAAAWSVYVLRCADGSLYTGITNDLGRRLLAHRAGTASKYTRSRLPVRVMCTMGPWSTRGRALREEARIKAMPRAEKLGLIRSYAAVRARR